MDEAMNDTKEFAFRETFHKKPFLSELRYPITKTTLEQAQVKREIILAERKLKLSQKFLEVQKVVEQVKARREKQASLFWSSLKTAESNRTLQLEQIRITNKQLVDRAKYIANQHRSQSKADRERRRIELEKRLEASEVRRLHFVKLSKSKQMKKEINSNNSIDKLSSSSSSPNSTMINKRRHPSLACLIHSFHHLNLPIYSQRDTWLNFHSLSQLLRQKNVLSITGKLLNRVLGHQDNRLNKSRVFLSSYMIVMCPRDILQKSCGPDESVLIESAKQLLHQFEIWANYPRNRQTKLAFIDTWYKFYKLFHEWKEKDRNELVDSLIAYYIELYSLQQCFHQSNEEEISIDHQLVLQMKQLKTKIAQIGNHKAIAKLMEQLSITEQQLREQKQDTMDDKDSDNDDGNEEVQDSQNIFQKEKKIKEGGKSSDNVSVTSKEDIEKYTEELSFVINNVPNVLLTNAQLLHELILDKDFQLQQYQEDDEDNNSDAVTSLEQRVKKMTFKAYFDRLRQDIQLEQYNYSVLSIIKDIKQKLLEMVEVGKISYQRINEAIDVELIEQQINHKTFHLNTIIKTILTCQQQLCAPSRDIIVEEIQSCENDPAWQLERIMKLLETMSLDLANFRLRSLRPFLKPIAIELEQQNFCQHYHLPNPVVNQHYPSSTYETSLPKTYHWIKEEAFKKWQQMTIERNPEGHAMGATRIPLVEDIFYDPFLSLLVHHPNFFDELPETWYLDIRRLALYQHEIQKLIKIAALLMIIKNINGIGHISSSSLSTLTKTLFTLFNNDDEDDINKKTTSTNHIILEILKYQPTISEEKKKLLISMVNRILSRNDSVYTLLANRVISVLKSQLIQHQFVSDATLISSSLDLIQQPLKELAIKLDHLCNHHLKVYLSWYSIILKHIHQ
ncbi:unnamed protein product [Cunninghamella echinulata]